MLVRVVKNRENPYVMLNKTGLNDPNLSYKAKGILAYLMSKPDDWKVIVADLANHSTDGEFAVRSGLKELIDNGYANFQRERDPETMVYTEGSYNVYESPDLNPRWEPHRRNPHVDNPHVDNHALLINDVTEESCTNTLPPSAASASADVITSEPEDSSVQEEPSEPETPSEPEEASGEPQDDHRAIFGALAELCAIDYKIAPKSELGKLNKVAKKLRDSGVTTDDLASFKNWWFANDWRGQKGQHPDPWDVPKQWGRYKAHYTNGHRGRNGNKNSVIGVPVDESHYAIGRGESVLDLIERGEA